MAETRIGGPFNGQGLLFAGTMLLSAWLVFLIQPMMGRMVLPLLGGAASVWITVSLFFQIALLAGYLYAHLVSARLRPKLQMIVHAVLSAAALIVLPVAVPPDWVPPTTRPPQADLILMMATTVGLPFLLVSSTAPLLQRWYSLTTARDAADPYFLYAASNIGSIAALMLYPLLVEPELGLVGQSHFWSISFAVLLALLAACAVVTLRHSRPVAGDIPNPVAAAGTLDWKQRLHWIALAAVPSSLFLAVTMQISTDIASVPLLWVLPLTVYLLTFVIAFARRPILSRSGVDRAIPYAATIAVLVQGFETSIGLPQIVVSLALLFLFALSCHSNLVASRPAPRHLTEFFLLMSLGGALGGAFNALLAPLLFSGVYEYPIAVLGAIALWGLAQAPDARAWRDWRWAAAAVVLFVVLRFALLEASLAMALQALLAIKVVAALLCFVNRRRPVALTFLAAAILAAGFDMTLRPELARHRSFFGTHRVELDIQNNAHLLMHGNTIHGAQFVDPARRREPLLYHGRAAPAGQLIEALRQTGPVSPAGIVGLGAGAMACLTAPGEDWTFFEIDPAVVETARDPRYFTYLADCAPDAKIVLGDGRLSLVAEPDETYRLLVLDAFGSDSIPVHLLTREAIALYVRKLAPRGVLLVQMSNRNIDLVPAVARLAQDQGLVGRWQRFPGLNAPGAMSAPSKWAVLAREEADLAPVAADPRWKPLPDAAQTRVWTDDYVNILSVILWPWR
jgi:hypothetical protein